MSILVSPRQAHAPDQQNLHQGRHQPLPDRLQRQMHYLHGVLEELSGGDRRDEFCLEAGTDYQCELIMHRLRGMRQRLPHGRATFRDVEGPRPGANRKR